MSEWCHTDQFESPRPLCLCCLLACCQVSEGIDFADGRARCVMVVGIPYPHAKDSKVALKKDYNNATASRGGMAAAAAGMRQGGFGAAGHSSGNSRSGPPRLLTGDAWYSQQAFRALNQVRGGGGGDWLQGLAPSSLKGMQLSGSYGPQMPFQTSSMLPVNGYQ